MPEQPEIEAYLAALRPRIVHRHLRQVRVASFSTLKTYAPPLKDACNQQVECVWRMGKRVVISLESSLHLVIHLMVGGRLHWHPPNQAIPKRIGLTTFDFDEGTLILTEAGSKRRASLHLVRGPDALTALDPGGIELLTASANEFAAALTAERHTLKRALSDARFISGIGGAFSDEILHRAQLSPLQMNFNLTKGEIERLRLAAIEVVVHWTDYLIAENGDKFPKKVTAFRREMAVHGKFGEECPVCSTPVQRIVYANRETNYCPTCQTDGKILADRSLSRLLKDDWPANADEL